MTDTGVREDFERPTVFVCGQSLRGDDGVAFAIAAALPADVCRKATIVAAGALHVGELLGLSARTPCIVLDAVVGVPAGAIVEIPLRELAGSPGPRGAASPAGRSTHALPIQDTLALASIVRGSPVQGTFIGVGIAQCAPGTKLSPQVAASIPAAAAAVAASISRHVSSPDPI